MNQRHLACMAICLPVATLLPGVAHAHLMNTGFGPFYDGVAHLVISPDNLLGAVGLALLAGLSGASFGRTLLLFLPAAWLLGGVIGLQFDQEVILTLWSTCSFLLVGLLVALDRQLPRTLFAVLATLLGLLHGFCNGTAMSAAGGGLLALFGISTTVFVIVTLLAALVIRLSPAWARLAVRVAGSWIASVGLLMIGWMLRGNG